MDTCSTQHSCSPSANARCLKLRHPFVLNAQQLINSSDDNSRSATHWADDRWNAEWLDKYNPTRLRTFIPDTSTQPPGMPIPRIGCVRLNCLHTGAGPFRSCLHKWGMAYFAACECCAEDQAMDHVVLWCPIHRPPHQLHGMTFLNDETIE